MIPFDDKLAFAVASAIAQLILASSFMGVLVAFIVIFIIREIGSLIDQHFASRHCQRLLDKRFGKVAE